MLLNKDPWTFQFVDLIKQLTRTYDRFCVTREVEDLDAAKIIQEGLNEFYEMSFELLDFVKLGRGLRENRLSHIFRCIYG